VDEKHAVKATIFCLHFTFISNIIGILKVTDFLLRQALSFPARPIRVDSPDHSCTTLIWLVESRFLASCINRGIGAPSARPIAASYIGRITPYGRGCFTRERGTNGILTSRGPTSIAAAFRWCQQMASPSGVGEKSRKTPRLDDLAYDVTAISLQRPALVPRLPYFRQ
jgi:hypothetical protein